MPHAEKVALITGASRGIGRGVALRMAKEGYTVVINSRTADPDNLTKGAYEVHKTILESGGKSVIFRADVSSSLERAELVSFIESEFGRHDLLVNNAGIEPPSLDMLKSDEERFDRVFSTNLKGPYFLTQQLTNRMGDWTKQGVQDGGHVIFVTSVQAYMANPRGAEYTMTKAALSMAARNYACRLAEFGICVYEISPGLIETDMSTVNREGAQKLIDTGNITKRWGQPEDVAALVACIARGDLDFSTGSTIEVGGGFGVHKLR
jgi:NAD(P)-dependent dehydrogenase (short-subunit alcohol dehydrogenase family)